MQSLSVPPDKRDAKANGLLVKAMQNITFFKNVQEEFGEETLVKICKLITYRQKRDTQIVFQQGELIRMHT